MTATHQTRHAQYLLADPIGRPDSGISAYTRYAHDCLSAHGVNVCSVIRQPEESIESFRLRLAERVDIESVHSAVTVEAPETGSATARMDPTRARLHIRLHCSKNLGAVVQGLPVDARIHAEEQTELMRASYVSAPSQGTVLASRQLFTLPGQVACYPNPLPAWSRQHPRDDAQARHRPTLLFVGRWQRLKGTGWLLELARRMPDMDFVAYSAVPERQRRQLPLNLRILEEPPDDKAALYARADAVIVPSVFETASMVALEALATGVTVVAWQHLGICEYAGYPSLHPVPAWDLDAFDATVRRAIESGSPNEMDHHAAMTALITDRFMDGWRRSQTGEITDLMPVAIAPSARPVVTRLSQGHIDGIMTDKSERSRWQRKLRKLRRDPVQFFKDSPMGRLLIRPGQARLVAPLPGTPAASRRFGSIPAQGRIRFEKPPSKPVGVICAFFYAQGDEARAQALLDSMKGFEDFRYLRAPLLQVGDFEKPQAASAVEIAERIDRENKQRISEVDHVILLDPPSSLVEGLRACGARQRLIVVLTQSSSELPDPWHTDVLITSGPTPAKAYRRVIEVSAPTSLHIAIRRAVSEGAPKSPDMMLPMVGFSQTCREQLLAASAGPNHGIIQLRQPQPNRFPRPSSMMCTDLAARIGALAVKESIYLRYRNLCDRLDEPSARAWFLNFALFDGVMFDVSDEAPNE